MYEERRYDEALEYYKLSGIDGYVDAQYKVGYFYSKGIGTQRNHKEAFFVLCYQKAL